MRLIDADVFMEYLGFDNTDEEREENVGQIVTLEDFDRQEIAYDVDKVIDELNRAVEYCRINHDDSGVWRFEQAIEIVKSGGVADE